jgi:hypothetical protein
MVCLKTQNPNLGKFGRVLQKMLEYFIAILSILRPFGIFMVIGYFYGHWVFLWSFCIFMVIWYILWLIGIFIPVLVCCIKKNLATLFTKRDRFRIRPLEAV